MTTKWEEQKYLQSFNKHSELQSSTDVVEANIDCDEFVAPIEDGFNQPYVAEIYSNEAVLKGKRDTE